MSNNDYYGSDAGRPSQAHLAYREQLQNRGHVSMYPVNSTLPCLRPPSRRPSPRPNVQVVTSWVQ